MKKFKKLIICVLAVSIVLCQMVTSASALNGSTSDQGSSLNFSWKTYLTASGNTATARVVASYDTSGAVPAAITASLQGNTYGTSGEVGVLSNSSTVGDVSVSDSVTAKTELRGAKCSYTVNSTNAGTLILGQVDN